MHFLKSPLWAVVAILALTEAAPPSLEGVSTAPRYSPLDHFRLSDI